MTRCKIHSHSNFGRKVRPLGRSLEPCAACMQLLMALIWMHLVSLMMTPVHVLLVPRQQGDNMLWFQLSEWCLYRTVSCIWHRCLIMVFLFFFSGSSELDWSSDLPHWRLQTQIWVNIVCRRSYHRTLHGSIEWCCILPPQSEDSWLIGTHSDPP